MDAAVRTDEELFEPEILQQLVKRLPSFVNYINSEDGEIADGHQSEMVLQREIGKHLKTWLPSSNLIIQNKMLVREGDNGYIPDIIINKIGGGCWAIFELKTLLLTDQLSVDLVQEDLEKLCKYELAHPNALCMFILIASDEKLTNSRRMKSWENLPISIDGDAFLSTAPRIQVINSTHVAIPWLFNDEAKPSVYIWLIRHNDRKNATRSGTYSFCARMNPLASTKI